MSRPPIPIVVKFEPLTEQYLPAEFVGRQAQVQELLKLMSLPGYRGHGVVGWLHGPPGTGKSSIARAILHHLEDRRVRTAYVNCWSAQTFYAAIEAVFTELRALVGEVRDVAFKLERLVQIADRHPLVIALDEIDQMPAKERNALLYNFSRLPSTRLVCLAQTREAFVDLDVRVQSRLQPFFVEFAPYSTDELEAILEARAVQSLLPESFCMVDLQRIASSSHGDARVAIQALRAAAYLAEKDRSPQLRVADIERGLRESAKLRRDYVIRGLSEHHRLIYRLVHEAGGSLATAETWRRYVAAAQENRLEPMARRTFNQYRLSLIASRLLRERQGRGKRNARILEVVE